MGFGGKAQCFGFALEETQGWKETFVAPGSSAAVLLAARVLLAVIWIPCMLWNFIATPNHEKVYWIIHLTSWSAVLETVFLVISAVGTYMALYSSRPDGRGAFVPWFATATWVMGAIVPSICTVVCVMFWALVFKPGDRIILHSVAVHGGNLLVAIADLALSRRPFRLGHVYMPMAFGGAYSMWTLVYYTIGGTHRNGTDPWIYRALYWGEARQASIIVFVVVFVAVPLFHVIFVGLYSCKQLCLPRKEASSTVSMEAETAAPTMSPETETTAPTVSPEIGTAAPTASMETESTEPETVAQCV